MLCIVNSRLEPSISKCDEARVVQSRGLNRRSWSRADRYGVPIFLFLRSHSITECVPRHASVPVYVEVGELQAIVPSREPNRKSAQAKVNQNDGTRSDQERILPYKLNLLWILGLLGVPYSLCRREWTSWCNTWMLSSTARCCGNMFTTPLGHPPLFCSARTTTPKIPLHILHLRR